MTEKLTHEHLVKALAKPGADIVASLSPGVAHALHMAIGISGEVDELVEACLNKDRKSIIEELGDIEFYAEGLRQAFGVRIPRGIAWQGEGDPTLRMVVAKGKVLEQAKKLAIYNDPSKWDSLLESLVYFYHLLDHFYKIVGIHVVQAKDANIDKLSKRYSEMTYSDEAAQTRQDKSGSL